MEQAYLDSSFTYVSAAIGKEFTQNIGLLTVHMFNHQTHHRAERRSLEKPVPLIVAINIAVRNEYRYFDKKKE